VEIGVGRISHGAVRVDQMSGRTLTPALARIAKDFFTSAWLLPNCSGFFAFLDWHHRM
jgi:hypothetical protein